jgi:hypothetical protein
MSLPIIFIESVINLRRNASELSAWVPQDEKHSTIRMTNIIFFQKQDAGIIYPLCFLSTGTWQRMQIDQSIAEADSL